MKQRRIITCAALLCALAGTQTVPASADRTTAHINPGVQYGVWQGWGTGLAWWANVVGGFPTIARNDYMTKAFDPIDGLGLNVVRYEISGGENPNNLPPAKSTIQYRARIPGYENAAGQWDWSVDTNQRWVLAHAMSMGANRVDTFCGSPPYWMTISGSLTGGHGGTGNLAPENDAKYADYLATIVKHFHDDWGVTFGTVEPLNEPSAAWWTYGNIQEGCHFRQDHQAHLIKALSASLKQAGVSETGIAASDENNIADGLSTFNSYDAETLGDLAKINVHGYSGGDRARLSQLAKQAGKQLWMSEYGDGDASGLTMSREILNDVLYLHPSAWIYWQFVDGKGWGLLVNPLKDETTTGYTMNLKYYVLGQYSRFIRPGYTIIDIDGGNSLAAYNAAAKTLVIVTTNDGKSAAPVSFDLSRFQSTGSNVEMVRTSATERWHHLPDLPISGGLFKDVTPAGSVTTYVITDAIAG